MDLELACGAINVVRMERALLASGFTPYRDYVWRWVAEGGEPRAIVKFELLADTPEVKNGSTLNFDDCERLGAVNLRGTGFAARDVVPRELRAVVDGTEREVEVNVVGLAGFLLATAAAAASRHREKDWYDIAYVLLHNDAGGVNAAVLAVQTRFRDDLTAGTRTALRELQANFANTQAQGACAYATQMLLDHPELSSATLRADAVLAVQTFCDHILGI